MSQDRLLATCEENRLDYVLDPTNFQPETTLRNAVRHMVSHRNDTLSIKEVCIPPIVTYVFTQALAGRFGQPFGCVHSSRSGDGPRTLQEI
jgi:hypothetical protein